MRSASSVWWVSDGESKPQLRMSEGRRFQAKEIAVAKTFRGENERQPRNRDGCHSVSKGRVFTYSFGEVVRARSHRTCIDCDEDSSFCSQ